MPATVSFSLISGSFMPRLSCKLSNLTNSSGSPLILGFFVSDEKVELRQCSQFSVVVEVLKGFVKVSDVFESDGNLRIRRSLSKLILKLLFSTFFSFEALCA